MNLKQDDRFWSGKRVCVTGGTGFLGYHIVKQLRAMNARVRVLSWPPPADHPLCQDSAIETVWRDVRDRRVVQRALDDCQVIFHTAGVVAMWGPALQQMHEIHTLGTQNVLAAARPEARIVHTSSIVGIGASRAGKVLSEESPFNLDRVRIDYVHAKRAAELLALKAAAAGQHVVVTNPGCLLGPEDYAQSVMGRFCVRFWKGRMPIAPPGGFNFVDVRDVARGHLLAAQHGRAGCRYVLGGENRTLQEFMAELARVAGWKPRPFPRLPSWLLSGLAGLATCWSWVTRKEPYPAVQHSRLNRYCWFYSSDRAVRELGYRFRPLAECLSDMYRWHFTNPRPLRGFNRWWMRPGSASRQAA